jgi:hypothetical protein
MRIRIPGATTTVANLGVLPGRSGAAAAEPRAEKPCQCPRTFGKKAMYENLMEEAVTPENHGKALRAVLRNDGAPGIDGMRTRN